MPKESGHAKVYPFKTGTKTPEGHSFLDTLQQKAMEQWSSFDWEKTKNLLNEVRDYFKSQGLNVKVEFFSRDNQDFNTDYIVIAEDKPNKEQGIVLPQDGVPISISSAFDLFLTPNRKVVLSPDTVAAFPKVERRLIDHKSDKTHWRVIEHGTLKTTS